MKQNILLAGIFITLVGIYGLFYIKTYKLNKQISNLEQQLQVTQKELEVYKLKYDRAVVIINNKDNYTNSLEKNVKDLLNRVSSQNRYISKLKHTNQQLNGSIQHLTRYKYLAKQYKDKLNKYIDLNKTYNTCKEGLELNKKISNLKYKDL